MKSAVAKSPGSLRKDSAVEPDVRKAGIRESVFQHRATAEQVWRISGRSIVILIAVLVCVSPGFGASGQVAAVPCKTSGSDSQATGPTSEPPFASSADSPTLFRFMPSRYEQMRDAIRGYQRSGVPLIALRGQEWQPAGKADDLGLSYFIPQIVRLTHADQNRAINIFLMLLLFIGFASGAVGMFLWLQNTLSRIVAIIGLTCLAAVTSLLGDVYIVQSAIVVMVVPWALCLWRQQKIGAGALVFALFAGFGAALARVLRSHSDTPIVLFLAVLFFAFHVPVHKRALVAVLFIAGFIVPVVYFHVLVSRRDAILEKLEPGYEPVAPRHPFWHTVYSGLGYLNNGYGLKGSDESVQDKARSIRPCVEFVSPEYEQIIRTEVFRIAKAHPRFIFETLAAKSGLLFIILLVCANLGLPSALLYRKPWAVEAAFWLGFASTATQGLLAFPNPKYLLGYMAFTVLYGILGIDFALAHGFLASRSKLTAHVKAPESGGQSAARECVSTAR